MINTESFTKPSVVDFGQLSIPSISQILSSLGYIIAVGFRVNFLLAIQFRQWAVSVLKDFALRGYLLDKERLKNGSFFNKEYFDNLLEEIRASERRFYQKITDIYATAMDYDTKAEITRHLA